MNSSNKGGHRSQALRRLMRELRLAQLEPSWGVSAAPVNDDDLFTWHCNVAGQPPGGGSPVILHLELTFPDEYPNRPPKVEVLGSTVQHPNVFSTFICLDMLEGGEWAAEEEKCRPYSGWSSAYSILAILRQLQTFFFEGDGTQWWKCATCTLHNPIKNRRCEVCEAPRGRIQQISIDVQHHPGFRCRCGHSHEGPEQPPFPDPVQCDDAPVSAPAPEGCPEDFCVICLGQLDEAPHRGPLRGAPGARPLARLVDELGEEVCSHWFHLPCVSELQLKNCPLCRTDFHDVQERKRDCAFSPPARGERANLACAPVSLCKPARERMARLAEFPQHLVTRIMSWLRRPDRACLARAVPAWQDAAQAPIFWEAQEVQCFHEKIGPDQDVIGIGVLAEGHGRLSKLTAHFDAVSLTAWQSGLRRAAWKEPMSHWLPLFIHRTHAEAAAPLLSECLAKLASCAPQNEDSHMPPPVFASLASTAAPQVAVDAVVALPELMHGLLKQVLDGDRHASLKLLKGYFVLHRLFLHCCEEWPAIRDAADAALRYFIECEEHRTRAATPWLAYLLQLLTISNVGWDEFKSAFLEEQLTRTVPFIRRQYPSYRPIDPDAAEKEAATQAANASSGWQLDEEHQGSWCDIGNKGAEEICPGCWRGRPLGWCRIVGPPKSGHGRHTFSFRLERFPRNSVVRIGWIASDDELVGAAELGLGWGYHSSPECFGSYGWKAHGGEWTPYGRCFREGDVLTACFDRGTISFACNGRSFGAAFHIRECLPEVQPAIAVMRDAEVRLLEDGTGDIDIFSATPQQIRNMAWDARLSLRGNKLVMFQAFFLSLVRLGSGTPDWESLKQEFDYRMGFPAPHMSDALFHHFSEVHRVASLKGCEAWPLFLKALGFEDISEATFDKMLCAAYERATRLGYKVPSGHGQHA
mmetsp:Transcript_128570/g.227697  ORF Transcript_128570/g.227697 Transcript_128570/m.227697 type:complete len:921 (+) Transcript_128570:90-2852(+)